MIWNDDVWYTRQTYMISVVTLLILENCKTSIVKTVDFLPHLPILHVYTEDTKDFISLLRGFAQVKRLMASRFNKWYGTRCKHAKQTDNETSCHVAFLPVSGIYRHIHLNRMSQSDAAAICIAVRRYECDAPLPRAPPPPRRSLL